MRGRLGQPYLFIFVVFVVKPDPHCRRLCGTHRPTLFIRVICGCRNMTRTASRQISFASFRVFSGQIFNSCSPQPRFSILWPAKHAKNRETDSSPFLVFPESVAIDNFSEIKITTSGSGSCLELFSQCLPLLCVALLAHYTSLSRNSSGGKKIGRTPPHRDNGRSKKTRPRIILAA